MIMTKNCIVSVYNTAARPPDKEEIKEGGDLAQKRYGMLYANAHIEAH